MSIEVNLSSLYLKTKRDIDLGAQTTTAITEVEFQQNFKCFCCHSSPDANKYK